MQDHIAALTHQASQLSLGDSTSSPLRSVRQPGQVRLSVPSQPSLTSFSGIRLRQYGLADTVHCRYVHCHCHTRWHVGCSR